MQQHEKEITDIIKLESVINDYKEMIDEKDEIIKELRKALQKFEKELTPCEIYKITIFSPILSSPLVYIGKTEQKSVKGSTENGSKKRFKQHLAKLKELSKRLFSICDSWEIVKEMEKNKKGKGMSIEMALLHSFDKKDAYTPSEAIKKYLTLNGENEKREKKERIKKYITLHGILTITPTAPLSNDEWNKIQFHYEGLEQAAHELNGIGLINSNSSPIFPYIHNYAGMYTINRENIRLF